MLKYDAFLKENLASDAKVEPKSNASKQAKQLGLTYAGFGRYLDQNGKVSYTVVNDKLVPYKGQEDIQKGYSNAVAKGDPEQIKAADAEVKTYNNIQKQDELYRRQKDKEVVNLHKELLNYYNVGMFSEDEIDAIKAYTEDAYIPVNTYLYKGHEPGTKYDMASAVVDIINNIDSAFQETQAPFAYTVYTGLSSRYDTKDFEQGKDYIFRGYVSASIDYKTALDSFSAIGSNNTKLILQIDIQKGQKSIYVDGLSDTEGELETLLPRGSRVKVISGPHMISDNSISDNPNGANIALFHCVLVEEI